MPHDPRQDCLNADHYAVNRGGRLSLMAHYRQKVFRMANVKKRGTSSVAALVMARTAQRVAQKNDDQEMLAEAKEYESRALAAIRQDLPELPAVEKPAE